MDYTQQLNAIIYGIGILIFLNVAALVIDGLRKK